MTSAELRRVPASDATAMLTSVRDGHFGSRDLYMFDPSQTV